MLSLIVWNGWDLSFAKVKELFDCLKSCSCCQVMMRDER